MKFKVLVAIAMAITSVNANEITDALMCIGRACLPRPKPAPSLYISVSKSSKYRKYEKSMKKGDPEAARKSRVCNPMISNLNTLWHINDDIDYTIRSHMPTLYSIIKDENGNDENNNDGTSHSRLQEIEDWLRSYSKHIPELKEMKVEHAAYPYVLLPISRALAARLTDFLQVAYQLVSIHIVKNTTWDRIVKVVLN
ncbi:hypothetical protein BASA50_011076 [Batrachochytrium salamandrivorans]|uniref:Uncharacterized protein n=1 Tax=Batrachochytrium salamandrivorans TaxID=1357716 RepID=A0ABQ8EWQ2_9FUNG|nr:hypothetical protein BASA50_011076 [Batrachochytrium salamandrivorans]